MLRSKRKLLDNNTILANLISGVENYLVRLNELNDRLKSWEHCYLAFYNARKNRETELPDYDYLSLHLGFYLASWGMFRPSSFLLQYDYKIHIPAIKEILKQEYDILFALEYKEILNNSEKIQQLFIRLNNQLNSIYKPYRKKSTERHISSTLITKILLGTLGCIPAYDRFFIKSARDTGITKGDYNFDNPLSNLLELAEFYQTHFKELEKYRKRLKVNDIEYPQMKILDMGLWQMSNQ